MTLRQTTRAIAVVTGLALVGCLYLTSELFLFDEIASLEKEVVRVHIDRSVHAFGRALDDLDRRAVEWSSDDTTVPPSTGGAPALLIVLDREHRLLSSHPLGNPALDIPAAHLTRPLSQAGLIGKPFKGIFTSESGPLIVASRTDIEPERRTILAAYRLEDAITNPSTGAGHTRLYEDAKDWPVALGPASPDPPDLVVEPLDGTTITGYHTLRDVLGRPAAVLRVDVPRTFYRSGLQTRNQLLILFGTFVLASAVLLVGAVRRTVLAPIDRISERLAAIARNGHTDERVAVSGAEEVSRLTTQVNQMLRRIRRSESEIIRTERMRVAGELSAGVSHNLNNILTGILGPAEYLEQNLEQPELLTEARRIHRAAVKARDLVSRFSQAVRHGTPVRSRAVDVNRTVAQAIETVRPRWQDEAQGRGVQIDVVTDLNAQLPIQGTADELHDILVNLLFNAVDALEEGGTIRITTDDDEGRVRMTVSDDGIGMSAATQDRLFEPFFTTKAEVGAGLGLATVHGTLRRWGGEIQVESEPGVGSTFTVDMPRSWATLPDSEPKAPPAARSGRVLIAEDDQIVREILQASLSESHTLLIAADGQEAMELASREAFDVALIDLSLPRVPGDHIARQIRRVNPTAVTVLMTGWDLSEDDPRRVPFDDHIPKPISSREEVQDVVARCLQVHESRRLRV